MLKDKDVELSLKILAPLVSEIIAVTPSNPRALSAYDFCKLARKFWPLGYPALQKEHAYVL